VCRQRYFRQDYTMDSQTIEPLCMSVADACRYVGIGKTELYERLKDGTLIKKKLGKRTLILTASLRKMIDELPSD
jgi:hypothetical protein